MRKLLVVESPNKVKKLRGFLEKREPGKWSVVATVGHWRGLPPMEGKAFEDVAGPSKGFEEEFVVQPNKAEVATRLASALANADEVYLATDADREGEAIAWHVAQQFKLTSPRRVLAKEITEKGVWAAIDRAGRIDEHLVEAQRARAVLDYLIGMEVSRLLWRFGAKSAGRLQSCALRILVEREKTILGFASKPWWRLRVRYREGFEATVGAFEAPTPEELDGDDKLAPEPRLVPRRFDSEEDARRMLEAVREARHVVDSVETKATQRLPPPPFTTADLLGTSATRLGFKADRTTALAHALFEKGVVTYIRTDSTALADEAIMDIRSYLGAHHPKLLASAPVVARQSASAQAAHEAIRPTCMTVAPGSLIADEQQLYDLIFERALCSQATPAILDRTKVQIVAAGVGLLAEGAVIRQLGWIELVPTTQLEAVELPALTVEQVLAVEAAELEAGKTRPPRRFTERSLIRYLERRGIGRPSTYASMVATLRQRGYVADEKRGLVPFELGLIADELVRLGFDELAREDFTAKTETALDAIEGGKLERVAFLEKFYARFRALHAKAVPAFEAFAAAHRDWDREATIVHEQPCPKCKGAMHVRRGPHGRYARCTTAGCGGILNLEPPKYHKRPCPKCGGKVIERPYQREGKSKTLFRCSVESCGWISSFAPPRVSKDRCPQCGSTMVLRRGAKGEFWSCSRYPECRATVPYRSRRPASSRV